MISSRIGRRKTWILLGQLGFAAICAVFYFKFDAWLHSENVLMLLTMIFALLMFISCSTIAVDGWFLTKMEQKEKGLCGPTTSFGYQAGILIGFSMAMKVETFLPEIFSLKTMFGALAVLLLVTTVAVVYFAEEKSTYAGTSKYTPSTKETYQKVLMILMKKEVRQLLPIMGTFTLTKACFSGLFMLKMQDRFNFIPFQIIFSTICKIQRLQPRPNRQRRNYSDASQNGDDCVGGSLCSEKAALCVLGRRHIFSRHQHWLRPTFSIL